jgi:ribose/xylose/arabinose/galactoside ABC-type transport system permease subunit
MMTQENRTQLSNVLVLIGLLVMLVMAVMPILNLNQEWMRWAFAVGAVTVLVGRLMGTYNGPSLRIKRLHRILITSAIMYCASAVMMFLSRGTNDWIGFLLAGVVVQVYASWMIDRESAKTEK